METKTAINVNSKASLKNCPIKTRLAAPITFRTPISFALLTERAVLKFIKLIQAISNINTATPINNRTYSMRPPERYPFLKFECRYFSLYNCKPNSSLSNLEYFLSYPAMKCWILDANFARLASFLNCTKVVGPLLFQSLIHGSRSVNKCQLIK